MNIGDKFVFEIDRIYSSKKHKKSRYGFRGFENFVLSERNIKDLLKYGSIKTLKNVIENETAVNCEMCDEYQRGLDEAWKAAREIMDIDTESLVKYYGLDPRGGDYGPNLHNIITMYTAAEVVKKLRDYEEARKAAEKTEQEFQVGDEIVVNGNEHGIVTCVGLSGIWVMRPNGYIWYADNRLELKKTGRNFPQISEAIQAMRENDG